MVKKTICISINEETHELIKKYARENHIPGKVSGAIDYIVWNWIKEQEHEKKRSEKHE